MEDIALYYQIATGIFGGLFVVSEALAKIPSIKANSVFQAIQNGLKFLSGNSDK